MSPLGEVAALFLKLGFIALGGPAAHISIFHIRSNIESTHSEDSKLKLGERTVSTPPLLG